MELRSSSRNGQGVGLLMRCLRAELLQQLWLFNRHSVSTGSDTNSPTQ